MLWLLGNHFLCTYLWVYHVSDPEFYMGVKYHMLFPLDEGTLNARSATKVQSHRADSPEPNNTEDLITLPGFSHFLVDTNNETNNPEEL